ncbi:unnamed protein product [Prunus armeniaca]
MVAKQAWRLLENPSSLVGRILQARYFPNGDFLTAGLDIALHSNFVIDRSMGRLEVLVSAYCSGCGTTTEDVVHAFWGCKRSRRFWALTSFNIDLAVRQGSFAGFLERVWKLRNEVLFGKIPDGLSEIVEWIMEFLEQFKIRNVHTKPARVPRFIRWIKPLSSALLLNLTERLDKLVVIEGLVVS